MASYLYEVPAPAKLNLFLHVIGKRHDGYHLLQTAFRFIDLCDYLHFERRHDSAIVRTESTLEGLAFEHDLCIRAAQLLQQATGTGYGVNLWCDKVIPAGGGLGGGSSNAASTLIALNKLWETGLTRQQLMRLGAQLGADVPIFIYGQNAFAEGIGDNFQKLNLPEAYYSLIQPNASIATAEIFSEKGLTRNTKPLIITDFTKWLAANSHCLTKRSVQQFGQNDLEKVVSKKNLNVNAVIKILQSLGLHARMTGSGSCVYVEYQKYNTAIRQHQQIRGRMLHLTQSLQPLVKASWLVQGLAHHPLYFWLK